MSASPEIAACTEALVGYASKGFFQGFSVIDESPKKASYNLLWHFNAPFQLDINLSSLKVQMPIVLYNVKARSKMDRDFRQFVQGFSDPTLPDHRRFEEGQIKVVNRDNNLSVALSIPENLSPDATAMWVGRYVSLVHEVFKVFLKNGNYDRYVGETYHIDVDTFW